jgi:hypothetical protein
MTISIRSRSWLLMQGYEGLSDSELSEIALWTRFSPALCMITAIIGTALASPWVLGALAVTAALGALLPMHPFDAIYTYGIRRLTGARALPPNGMPRRFACAVGAVWLVAAVIAFASGAASVGYVVGALFVCVAGVLTATGFCIPSFTFRTCETQIIGRRASSA